jgi:membrane protein
MAVTLVTPIQRTASRPPVWLLLVYAALSKIVFGRGRSSVKFDRSRGREQGTAKAEITGSKDDAQHLTGERARERGRGRRAEKPWQIPWVGWKDILWRSYQEVSDDRLLAVAAGVVFYGLLAVFPAISALVSMYGLFADAATISEHLSLLAGILPQGGLDIVQEQITRITSKGNATLGFGFILSLVLALWSANAGMKAIIDALNIVYDEKEKRGFIRLKLTSLTLTLGAILSLLLAIGAVIVLPLLLNYVGLSGVSEMLLRVSRWPALLVLVIVGLAVLYRFGPSRTKARWEWLTVGSLFAAVAWLMASALLSWYLANFADYNATYGSLGAAIGLMMWLWISSIVILFGAELNSEIEHQTARDSTVGRDKPLGARGAAMADTVGGSSEN